MQPSGYEPDSDDCDDTAAEINPSATEYCDGVDNDCSGDADSEGLITLDSTANYSTIARAITNASTGSTIVACDGSYAENLTITDDLTLESLNGSGSSTLDGGSAGAVVRVQSGEVTISGFTISDGSGGSNPSDSSQMVGGGIMVLGSDPVLVEDCIIINNDADFGGGIFVLSGGELAVVDTTLELNDADLSGGAIYLEEAVADFSGVVIEDNFAAYAGGVYADGGSLTMESSTFEDNYASIGGGLISDGATVTASDDTAFTNNTASDDGGGALLLDGSVWSGGEFTGNEASYGGGMSAWIIDDGDTIEIEDAVFDDNDADASGGGIYIIGDATLTGMSFTSNTADYGGALFLDETTTYIINSVVEDNIVNYWGGGAYVYDDVAFFSVNTDWGSGSTDNDPDDVYLDGASTSYASYGSAETFTCSDTIGSCY